MADPDSDRKQDSELELREITCDFMCSKPAMSRVWQGYTRSCWSQYPPQQGTQYLFFKQFQLQYLMSELQFLTSSANQLNQI